MKNFFLCVVLLLSYGGLVYGQTQPAPSQLNQAEKLTCATTEYGEWQQLNYPGLESPADFEEWLAPLKEARENQNFGAGQNSLSCSGIPQIGIVFHIIHNGEPIGSGANLDASLINAQLEQINLDFDGIIDFCLAGEDENGNGLPEFGINRVNRFDTNWPSDVLEVCDAYGNLFPIPVETYIKPSTQWDPERYVNVWVMPMTCEGVASISGYAQFPQSSGLPGVPTFPSTANTDGVVMLSGVVGGTTQANPNAPVPGYGTGGSLIHELGHFFGVLHTWGSGGGCVADDFCSDTPSSFGPNFSCTQNSSCGTFDMVENHMEYTPDACRFIFTACQVSRMQTVLANSPRRVNLCNSGVCCEELAEAKFRFKDVNGNPEKEFCAGEKVFIDASNTIGESAYSLSVSTRPLTGGTTDLLYDFAWTTGQVPSYIDLFDWLAGVGIGPKAGFEYIVTLEIEGTCDVLSKTKRFKYYSSTPDIDFELQDINGNIVESLCVGDALFIHPETIPFATSHSIRVLRRPLGGIDVGTYYDSGDLAGEPTIFAISEALELAGTPFEEGYEYTIILEVSGKCFADIEARKSITFLNCIPQCTPPENLRCETFESINRLAWDPVSLAVDYEIYIIVNDYSCGCSGALEDRFVTISTPYYNLPTDLLSACYSWKVKANCGFIGSSDYSDPVCFTSGNSCDIIGLRQTESSQIAMKNFNVYPNPSTGNVVVEWDVKEDTEIQISIFDLNGRLVYQSEKDKVPSGIYRNALDLRTRLEEGLYFLQLQSTTATYKQKLMIMK